MKKIKIGVLCPSEIAFRRFVPSLKKCTEFEYAGVASAGVDEWFGEDSARDAVVASECEKAAKFTDSYGGVRFGSYCDLLTSDIDAVYIPLPPALHYKWAKMALENGKHVLLEKPFTTDFNQTQELTDIAAERKLALHENYMFEFHSQLTFIKNKIETNAIGDLRLIRVDFGFPFRGKSDFRYNKDLGGGALLDCGGYTAKLAAILLGETTRVADSRLNYVEGCGVDMFGNAVLINDKGLAAQVSFGMDNSYKCNLEVWGSEGTLFTNRILTAPDDFRAEIIIKTGGCEEKHSLEPDSSFKNSIEKFAECIFNADERQNRYEKIILQAKLMESLKMKKEW